MSGRVCQQTLGEGQYVRQGCASSATGRIDKLQALGLRSSILQDSEQGRDDKAKSVSN